MIRWLFDTDHVTLLGHGHPVLQGRIAAALPDAVAACPVTVEEVLRGRLAYLARNLNAADRLRAYANLVLSVQFFQGVPLVPFDQNCENHFQHLRASRVKVKTMDLRIAATALAHVDAPNEESA